MNFKEPMNCGKKILRFKVMGEPVGQGRPRFTTISGHVRAYEPKGSTEEKAAIRLMAQQAMAEQGWSLPSPEMPLKVEIKSCRKAPSGRQKWFAEAGLLEAVMPLGKPDGDNIVKLYLDAMNGVVYPDDKQVYDIHIIKMYADAPYTEVVVTGYYQNMGEVKAVANASLKRKREAKKNYV